MVVSSAFGSFGTPFRDDQSCFVAMSFGIWEYQQGVQDRWKIPTSHVTNHQRFHETILVLSVEVLAISVNRKSSRHTKVIEMEQVKHCPLGGSLQCWYERTVRWLRMTSCDSVSKILFSVVPSHIFLDGDLRQPTKETEVAGCTDCSLSSNDCGFREDDRYYVDNDVQGSSDTGTQLQ
jgi:hypothetical protein